MKGDKRRAKMVLQSVLWILCLYAGYCFLLFLFQRSILFPRFQVDFESATELEIPDLERLWLKTSFGNVEAWYLPPIRKQADGPAPALIFAHGNGELIDFWPEELRPLTELGMGVLLVEYPGYGRSAGSPSQKRITEVFVLAYDRLLEMAEVDSSRIVFFGRSLGGGVACALAAERPAAALILLSTFTSVRACAIKFLAPGFLVKDPFDNLAVLRSYAGPVLVIHGKKDTLIPYSHGMKLSQVAKHATLVTYDCGHNDCPPNWQVMWRDVETFLTTATIIRKRL
jgi:fermentation-respiration switch protein FrsA (DUF1100 family)